MQILHSFRYLLYTSLLLVFVSSTTPLPPLCNKLQNFDISYRCFCSIRLSCQALYFNTRCTYHTAPRRCHLQLTVTCFVYVVGHHHHYQHHQYHQPCFTQWRCAVWCSGLKESQQHQLMYVIFAKYEDLWLTLT